MLINEYLKSYLDFYSQVNLLSMGTLYKVPIAANLEGETLSPPSYTFQLDELKSDHIDHFVMFISQYENRNFDEVYQEVISDFQYCNTLLNEGESVLITSIGHVRIFQNRVRLFVEDYASKTYGYPSILIK